MNINTFLKSESGAVTTEYVLWITASVRSTMTMVAVPSDGVETLADRIATDLSSGTIVFTSFKGLASEDRVLSSTRIASDDGGEGEGPGDDTDASGDTGGPQGNNGWGNGDQDAPGNSGPNSNAENGGGDPPPGQSRLRLRSRRTTASAASVILPYRR
jgi:hypothetical protein